MGLPWAWVWSNQVITRTVVVPICRALFLCCPLEGFCWWLDPIVKPAVCPQSTSGNSQTSVCGYSFLSLGHKPLLTGSGPHWVCLHTASLVVLLWMDTSQGCVCEGASPQESDAKQDWCKSTTVGYLQSPWKTVWPGWKGQVDRVQGWSHKLAGKPLGCNGFCRCQCI